jgi:hypothetical protein
MSVQPLVRTAANTVSAAAASVVLRSAFNAAPVVTNTLMTGLATTAAGTYDMVDLITHSNDRTKFSEVATRGVGSASQIIGGLMFMSKSSNPDVKAAAATLSVGGSLMKVVQAHVKNSYASGIAQGAILGVSIATIFQLSQGVLNTAARGFGGTFNTRALIVCGAIGVTAAAIGTAVNKADDAYQAQIAAPAAH